jgi:hypothetical protein
VSERAACVAVLRAVQRARRVSDHRADVEQVWVGRGRQRALSVEARDGIRSHRRALVQAVAASICFQALHVDVIARESVQRVGNAQRARMRKILGREVCAYRRGEKVALETRSSPGLFVELTLQRRLGTRGTVEGVEELHVGDSVGRVNVGWVRRVRDVVLAVLGGTVRTYAFNRVMK